MGRLGLQLDHVRTALYLEILEADRTATSLIEQGYVRVHVQKCMPMLIEAGLVFKYGHGKFSYYSADQIESMEPRKAVSRKLNPVVIPDTFKENPELAFRMGYTDVPPAKGRVFRGVLHDQKS